MINTISYRIVLLLAIEYLWMQMYLAYISEYDQNYGHFIYAMTLSLACTLIIEFGVLKRQSIFVENKFFNRLFIVLASPVSLLAFVLFFESCIGVYFKK